MAATSVPQLIAYAETVGYAGYRGLTTAGAPLLVWGLATGKRKEIIHSMNYDTFGLVDLALTLMGSCIFLLLFFPPIMSLY